MFCFTIAPKSMSIESASTTELEVTIEPNSVTTGVTVYLVSTTGASCEAQASANPLMCKLSGLTAATRYTVEAKACATAAHCSEPISGEEFTRPLGE